MPLQKQALEVRLAGGLAEGVDEKIVDPPGLLACQNVVFTRAGSIEKRSGFALVESQRTTSGSLGDVNRLIASPANLFACEETQANSTGPVLYTQTPAQSNRWRPAGRLPSMVPSRVSDLSTSRLVLAGQTVVSSGKIVAVYRSQDPATLYLDTYYKVIDSTTGEVIQPETLILAGTSLVDGDGYLLMVGTTAVWVYFNLLAGCCVRYLDTATTNMFGAQTVLFGAGFATIGGACTLNSGEYAISIQVGANVLLRQLDLNSALLGSITVLGRTTGKIDGNASVCWFAVENGGVQEYGQILVSSWSISLAPVNALVTGVGYKLLHISATRCLLAKTLSANYAAPFAAYTYLYVETAIRDDTGAAVGVNQLCYNCEVWAMAAFDNRVYALVTTTTGVFANLSLVMLRNLAVPTEQEQPLPEALVIRDYAFTANSLFKDETNGAIYTFATEIVSDQLATYEGSGAPNKQIRGALFKFDYSKPTEVYEANRHFSAGSLFLYDSSRVVECNFWQDPIIVGFSTPGAGAVPAGSYSVTAAYSWLGSDGLTHRSRLSPPKTWVAPGGTAAPELLVTTCGITQKERTTDGPNRVRIETYITGQNGTVYQVDRYYDNNPNTPAVSFTLGTTITGTGLVYTTGRVLENEPPPPSVYVCEHRGRLWIINAVNRRELWYSKEYESGEAPGFSPGLTLLCNARRDLTALASLNDKLVIFSDKEIFYTVGDGPTRTGDPPFYPQPYQITDDVGCDSPTTIVDFEGGLAFVSGRAIYVLGADLGVSKISEPIKRTIDDYPTITQGAADPINRRLYWVATNANNQSIILVFDYQYKTWATWRTEEDVDFNTPFIVTMAVKSGVLHYFGSAGGLVSQSAIDGWDTTTSWVNFKLRTPAVKLSGLTGYERAYRVNLQADQLGPCDVSIGLIYDFRDQPSHVKTFVNADLAAGSVAPVVRAEVHCERQKCTALALIIADSDPGGSPSASVLGLRIQGFGIQIGLKQGAQKLAPTVRK